MDALQPTPPSPSSNAVDESPPNPDSIHFVSFPEGSSQAQDLQDRDPLTDDPESPRDIVEENILVVFPLALLFVFLVCGLVIAFSE